MRLIAFRGRFGFRGRFEHVLAATSEPTLFIMPGPRRQAPEFIAIHGVEVDAPYLEYRIGEDKHYCLVCDKPVDNIQHLCNKGHVNALWRWLYGDIWTDGRYNESDAPWASIRANPDYRWEYSPKGKGKGTRPPAANGPALVPGGAWAAAAAGATPAGSGAAVAQQPAQPAASTAAQQRAQQPGRQQPTPLSPPGSQQQNPLFRPMYDLQKSVENATETLESVGETFINHTNSNNELKGAIHDTQTAILQLTDSVKGSFDKMQADHDAKSKSFEEFMKTTNDGFNHARTQVGDIWTDMRIMKDESRDEGRALLSEELKKAISEITKSVAEVKSLVARQDSVSSPSVLPGRRRPHPGHGLAPLAGSSSAPGIDSVKRCASDGKLDSRVRPLRSQELSGQVRPLRSQEYAK